VYNNYKKDAVQKNARREREREIGLGKKRDLH
jgi:hypothetical protein